MKKIPLTRGLFALVDAGDYDLVSTHKWCAQKIGDKIYACARQRPRYLYMHRVILKAKKGEQVDHRDHDGLNNQRSNLRLCTQSQNFMHKNKRRDSTAPYKGITLTKASGRWMARIGSNNKQRHLGTFSDPVEAAKAYDRAAKKIHGEFAVLNFPEER